MFSLGIELQSLVPSELFLRSQAIFPVLNLEY